MALSIAMMEEAHHLRIGQPGRFAPASGLRGKKTWRVIFMRDRNIGFGSHIEVCGHTGKQIRYASYAACLRAAIRLQQSGKFPDQEKRGNWNPDIGFL